MPILLLLLAGGCAQSPARTGPPPLPEPSRLHLTATADVHLTPTMQTQTGLPARLKATLEAEARSAAISASPLRSHHAGHLSLHLTDGSGRLSLANVNLSMEGDSAGSPTEGLGEAMQRFMEAASLMMRSIPPAPPPPPPTRPSP
jgi:hypothetical protein